MLGPLICLWELGTLWSSPWNYLRKWLAGAPRSAFLPSYKMLKLLLCYQENGEMYEVNANDACRGKCSPVLSWSCFALHFSSRPSFLKSNTTDLSGSKMLQKYTGRGFFLSFCGSIACCVVSEALPLVAPSGEFPPNQRAFFWKSSKIDLFHFFQSYRVHPCAEVTIVYPTSPLF